MAFYIFPLGGFIIFNKVKIQTCPCRFEVGEIDLPFFVYQNFNGKGIVNRRRNSGNGDVLIATGQFNMFRTRVDHPSSPSVFLFW